MNQSSLQDQTDRPPAGPKPLPPPNPVTHQKHSHEVLWQITVPLLVGVVVVVALAVLVTFGSAARISRWADISTIWLIIPGLFVGLVFIALFGGITYLLLLAIRKLPPYARLAQAFFVKVNTAVRKASDKAVEPVLKVEGWRASWRALWRR